jgi:hypothetical protein
MSFLIEPIQPPHPKFFTFKELIQAIKSLKPNKAPGHDHITTTLQQLPRKGQMKLLHIYNSILRLDYWPRPLNFAHIIMILKPGTTPTDVASYRRISLLPRTAKVLEKMLITRLTQESNLQSWLPDHQLGFRAAHSTVQQTHRITTTITTALSSKQYCTAAFLDVAQAFDKV